jgi:hypothetical protein
MALSTPRLVLLVSGVLLVVCGVAVGVSEALTHDRTTLATVRRHIERVIVHADTGNVHLEGTESPRVMVREQLRWMWSRPRVVTSVDGSTLTVSGSCPDSGPLNRCKADLDLAIPFDADVIVQGDSGDITAERLAGHIELRTDSGNLSGRELNPISVSAITDAGNVDLDFSTQPVSVQANSDSGNVDVTVPAGGEYRVDATTDAGDVEVRGVLRNDRALRSISATADAGDVTVRGATS